MPAASLHLPGPTTSRSARWGDPAERVLEFIASTAQVDRYGDIIEVEGWELDNWLKVPVILSGHDYGSFPIG